MEMINLRNRNKNIEENCIQSLRDLCDTIWLTNILIMRVPENRKSVQRNSLNAYDRYSISIHYIIQMNKKRDTTAEEMGKKEITEK